MSPTPLPRTTVELDWVSDFHFIGGPPGGPQIAMDGSAKIAPSPVSQLLLAAAACAGTDVVDIIRKMRIDLTGCHVSASGQRREEPPRRLLDLHLVFTLTGSGLDEAKARRAIELSITKYCSVISSLDPDLPVTWDLELK